jgi:hypothetical protein
MREITANSSKRWISPPATWKTPNPVIQAIKRIMNKMVQRLIAIAPLALLNGFQPAPF